MYFQFKMLENGTKYICIDKKTTKNVELMFFDVEVLTER